MTTIMPTMMTMVTRMTRSISSAFFVRKPLMSDATTFAVAVVSCIFSPLLVVVIMNTFLLVVASSFALRSAEIILVSPASTITVFVGAYVIVAQSSAPVTLTVYDFRSFPVLCMVTGYVIRFPGRTVSSCGVLAVDAVKVVPLIVIVPAVMVSVL